MKNNNKAPQFFDDGFIASEQLPRRFTISFNQSVIDKNKMVKVVFNDTTQVGDVIDDNAHSDDYYRFHDIFHYTFATMLGWSPCARAMIKCKRKSNELIDKIEDGARATITEEAISMIIFNEAKRKQYFAETNYISKTTLRTIREMTESFEVRACSEKDWRKAILESYKIFRQLIDSQGGKVSFDAFQKAVTFHAH